MTNLLSADWLRRLDRYKKLLVGFSGGLDSTVLLHSLASQPNLAKKLLAVHINHGLSHNALTWQKHCQDFCAELGIMLQTQQVEFTRHANIEEEARRARYQAFASLLTADDCLILAHHLDDQAETVLLQLFRGAGVDGLAAMACVKGFAESPSPFEANMGKELRASDPSSGLRASFSHVWGEGKMKEFFGEGQILRPFLELRRQNLEDYAREQQLSWIEDESNQNTSFSRNFLRQEVIPLLAARWPGLVTNLARTASHCRQAQSNLDDLAKLDCPELEPVSERLSLNALTRLTEARIINVLRSWLKANHIRIPGTLTFNRLLNEVIAAPEDAQPHVAWQGGCIRRYQQTLYLMKNEGVQALTAKNWSCFPQPLLIDGLGTLCVKSVVQGLVIPPQSAIEIRFRQGGEVFYWRRQNKQLKKLMQDWSIPPWQRERIPLLYVNGQFAAVVGFAVSDLFYGADGVALEILR